MNPLALLLAAHLIGDWIVQTDWQAANKVWPRPESEWADARWRVPVDDAHPDPAADHRAYVQRWLRGRSWKANQQHMLGYHLTMLAALAFAPGNVKAKGLILAISWATHSFIDRRWPVRWLCDHTGSRAFGQTTFGMIAVDQALHLSILCVLAGVLA